MTLGIRDSEAPLPVHVLEFAVHFELTVPSELRSRLSARDDYMRLGTILPLLPWEPGRGWALDPPTSLFAEAVSSPTADWAVRISVPDGYAVLTSGVPDERDVWRVEAARDFAVSVGRFRTVSGTAMAPEPVPRSRTLAAGPRRSASAISTSVSGRSTWRGGCS